MALILFLLCYLALCIILLLLLIIIPVGRRKKMTETFNADDTELFNDPTRGRCLLVDGKEYVCEQEEYVYHEMLVHFPSRYLDAPPGRVLLIGGGDCLALRQLMKQSDTLESVLVIEPDERLKALSEEHLSSAWCFRGDAKVRWMHGNVPDLVRKLARNEAYFSSFDLVLIDDKAHRQSLRLQQETYTDLKTILRSTGVLAQSGDERTREAVARVFSHTLTFAWRTSDGTEGTIVMATILPPTVSSSRADTNDNTQYYRQDNHAFHIVHGGKHKLDLISGIRPLTLTSGIRHMHPLHPLRPPKEEDEEEEANKTMGEAKVVFVPRQSNNNG